MQRIVRDTSKALNKKVVLELIGEETEIDKTVLEHLSDPLVHIVRNAVDHGLETTEGRIASGKSEQGTVTIKAFHEGNNLVIEISDNGKGINPNIIREKAIEKGVIKASTQLSDDEIVNLIFHPGFSTKSEVSEISGRGVGMDVVKTNIEKLSGEVKVFTEVGKGSVFKVVLPLTLAIIEGMITKIGNERYIIPLAQVYESLSPSKDIVHYVNGVGECLKLRGQVIPLFKISKALQRNVVEKPLHEQIAIIVNNEDKSFAVLVDDILHQQQVVIKKLGHEIKNQKGFMGSSILGDGRPAFILDLVELFDGSMKKKKTNPKEEMVA
jgi:two-component system chemotaxis sensor kinase CheA